MLDPDAVEQIVGNLLSNVEKYAPGAPVTVTTALEGDRAILTVHDGGLGIPPGEREAVFAPFVRLSDRLTEGVAGTGIGLTIARTLARLHGGELRIVATDVGACFEATLAAPATADATEDTACAS
jgi:signal transduction histidine kinase